MIITGPIPRDYQAQCIEKNLEFFSTKYAKPFLNICPTASGKSIILANTFGQLTDGKSIIFQPSKEILEQNYSKFLSYGYRAGIYSASMGMKFVDQITFATIGSVASKPHLFKEVKYMGIDECHLVNANGGQYKDFIHDLNEHRKPIDKVKIVGLTATPYRLASNSMGTELRFLNRLSPRLFSDVAYYIQNKTLFDAGHLAPLEYYNFNIINRSMLKMNSSGSDYTESSLQALYRSINMPQTTAYYANRVLNKRKNLLIFCAMVSEAVKTSHLIDGSVVLTAETPPAQRDKIIKQFQKGIIRCVINVGVLTTGFDMPSLEAVLLARSTMSLALYYQMVGRVMRPFTYPDGTKKTGWVIDLGNNIPFFGHIEHLRIRVDKTGLYSVWTMPPEGRPRQLTNVPFEK